MFQNNPINYGDVQYPVDDDGRLLDVQPVDPVYQQEFMCGENGFVRNEVARVMAAENTQLQEALISKLGEYKGVQGYSYDTPVSQIVSEIIPRSVQTAASCREFLSSLETGSIKEFVDKAKADFDTRSKVDNKSSSDASDSGIDNIIDNV